jgi:hypothetical protein
VAYAAKGLNPELGSCHCDMCRRWTGSFLITSSSNDVAWTGEDKIVRFQSSDTEAEVIAKFGGL